MMILSQPQLDQSIIQDRLEKLTGKKDWYASPEALGQVLNEISKGNSFFTYTVGSATELMSSIVASIRKRNLPAAVPVLADCHWVIVEGVRTNVVPTPGASYSVEGVWVHNPEPWGFDPPPHGATDDCGIGGPLGVAAEYKVYAEWLDWIGRVENPAFMNTCILDAQPANVGTLMPTEQPPSSQGTVTDAKAITIAEAGIVEHELLPYIGAKGELQGGQPWYIEGEENFSDYWLVPLWDNQVICATAEVDATGRLRSVAIPKKPVERVLLTIDELATIAPGIPRAAWRLIWKPSQQSWSPHLPFYRAVLPSGLLSTKQHIYVRADGQIFNRLTNEGYGG